MGGPSLSFTMAKLTDFQTGFPCARKRATMQVVNRMKISKRVNLGMVGEDNCGTNAAKISARDYRAELTSFDALRL
jgi:hypothetical protein